MFSCSLIICTRDRASALAETLNALERVAIPAGCTAELLIVDNGSSDNTAAIVSDVRLSNIPSKYLYEPRRGQCFARNTGIAAAAGDIIIFLDDDVIPSRDWLVTMCEPILEGRAEAVAGGIVMAPHLLRAWMEPLHKSWLAGTEEFDPAAPDTLVGGNMAFSRRVLERVPAFDTALGPGQLGFGDDTLFGWQLKVAGYRLASAFQAPVEHHFDPSRLTRASFMSAARARGRTIAYLDYHWYHREERWPALLLARAFLRLLVWWVSHPKYVFRNEGATTAEMYHIWNLHRRLRYFRERTRPRNYDREGLTKKPQPSGRCGNRSQRGEGKCRR